MVDLAPRRMLFRWMGWFGVANTGVLAVIGLAFAGGFAPGDSQLAWIYMITIMVGHHALLALLPLSILVTPLIWLAPRRRLVFAVAVTLFAAIIALLVLDGLLWSQSHFHINLLTARILGWQSWLFVGLMFLIGIVFQSLLAGWLWRGVQDVRFAGGPWVATVIVLCFLTAQAIYAWADASYFVPVTRVAQRLPVHRGITAKKFLSRHGLVDVQQSRERRLAARLARGPERRSAALDYPQAPLECRQNEPLNLLILMLDAWRFDMLNERVTPNLWHWAQQNALRFEEHFSGGNSSRMGVFSFFYGLPPGYFDSFEAVQQPALLIIEAQRQGYQLGLFASADMYRPVTLDRTAFANVPDLRIKPEDPAAPAWRRDQEMVAAWHSFLDQRDPRAPFLGFLFFDSPNLKHAPPGYSGRFAPGAEMPMAEKFADYQTAIHFTDTLVDRVLEDLKSSGLHDETVVIVTSDHGEAFMESGSEYGNHGSAYDRYQLQVPMLIAWPGREPGVVRKRTSHFDVAPTLLGRLFGCTNPPADYSCGEDLFTRSDWQWIIAGSYYNYAVLEPDQITITFPNGLYEVRDWDYRVLESPAFRADVLEEVMRENRRFYR